ncbi:MAG: hypothetical protein F9K22_06915 [Bacteroidetes bacterium]|nr:MAG: hypothetical protein F9K22_06915 [Bacteroidota bacterium]
MQPLYRSRFHPFWDGAFVFLTSALWVYIPYLLYAPNVETFVDALPMLAGVHAAGLLLFYSFTLKVLTVFPFGTVFTRPLSPFRRSVTVPVRSIVQAEIVRGARPVLTVYHDGAEESIALYEEEIRPLQQALAQIGITADKT